MKQVQLNARRNKYQNQTIQVTCMTGCCRAITFYRTRKTHRNSCNREVITSLGTRGRRPSVTIHIVCLKNLLPPSRIQRFPQKRLAKIIELRKAISS